MSSGSSPHSSGSLPHNKSSQHHKPKHQLPNNQSTGVSKSSDTRIFRGAEILRKQIVQGTFKDDKDKDNLYLRHFSAGAHDVGDPPIEDYGYPHDSDDDSSNWSEPRPPPQPETIPTTTHRGRVANSSSSSSTRWNPAAAATHDSKPGMFGNPTNTRRSNKLWTHYVSDTETEDEEEPEVINDDSDDSTSAVLARASQLMAMTPCAAASSSEMDPEPSAQVPQQPFLVRRINELETRSTFDSSSLVGSPTTGFPYLNCSSYLPKNLLQNYSPPCPVDSTPQPTTTTAKTTNQLQGQATPSDQDFSDLDFWALLEQPQGREQQQQKQTQKQQQQQKNQSVWRQGNQQQPVRWKPANEALTSALSTKNIQKQNPCDSIVSPQSPLYRKLMREPGFCHAQQAGILWQSLVSQHVRFPAQWWNGTRHPPMGVGTPRPWKHIGRHRVRGNPFLQRMVRSRGSAGRLLLHVIVRDVMTGEAVLDLAVGCFHPNARGIRVSDSASSDPSLEPCRDIWLALRPRSDEVSAIDSLLLLEPHDHHRDPEDSPLGDKRAVHNHNLRAVFGEMPPVYTILQAESDLYEIFSRRLGDGGVPPAVVLLEEFVEDW